MRYALLLLMACGSPASQFVGEWSGPESLTLTPDLSDSTPRVIAGRPRVLQVAEDLTTGRVDIGCMTAQVDGDKLRVSQSSVPCREAFDGCVMDTTVATGVGVIRGDAMTLETGGAYEIDCDGVVERGSHVQRANLSRVR